MKSKLKTIHIMDKLKNNYFSKLKTNNVIAGAFILVFVLIGVRLITNSHASGPFAAFNADQGTLANGAIVQSDSSASDGKYVSLGKPPIVNTGKDEGLTRYRLDGSSSWDSYASNSAFLKAHVFKVMGYFPAPAAFNYVSAHMPGGVMGYYDPNGPGSPINLSGSGLQTFRDKVTSDLNSGSVGVFQDDTNWTSGYQPMHNSPQSLVNAVQAIRGDHPNAWIEINSQYHDIQPILDNPNDPNHALVVQELGYVNAVDKEFGVSSIAGISSPSAYDTFINFVNELHAKNVAIDIQGHDTSSSDLEYNLATYYLVNNGGDFVGGPSSFNPTSWWAGWSSADGSKLLDLGSATSPAVNNTSKSTCGLLTRTFQHGVVYVVEPGSSCPAFNPPSGAIDVNTHQSVTTLNLSGGSGAVLSLP